ncbi:LacI family DNA-binding transcriptional regulator [Shimia sp. NS0008-38b]|uniref:LacI family DNA-binding transcriptional regulator n=1 Tax=Shimia sp. NS0008-38b TaxID=3127653 RepID=UPI00310ACB82
MRPTTKDLAETAGVSLATVDRVLNGRSGVRQKTIDAVNEAIRSLGFERNQFAATLARQKGYRFAFILPKDGDEYLAEIIKRIEETKEAGRAEMLDIKVLRVDEQNPHETARYLSRLKGEDYDGAAIMAPETPQIRDAIRRMKERGILTIPFVSNQRDEDQHDFVGIDNRAAGRTVGRLMGRFIGPREGTIAVLTDTMQARDSLERRLGFDEVINGSFPMLSVLPTLETYGEPERTFDIVRNVLSHQKALAGFYVMGSEARVPLKALANFCDTQTFTAIAHEKTPTTIQGLRAGKLDAVVTQDPGHLVRSAVRILRSKCENRTTLASQEKIRIEILIEENL